MSRNKWRVLYEKNLKEFNQALTNGEAQRVGRISKEFIKK